MIDHRTARELAATAIDFALDDAARSVLDEHLATCSTCRAEAGALRADASALAGLPAIAPPSWVRRVIGRRRGPRRAVLLVAAALVLMGTIGVALAVGAALRHQVSPDPLRSPAPGPSASIISPGPSLASSPSPAATPSPSIGPPPVVSPTSFPSGSGSAWMGAGPAGATWLLTVHEGANDADPSESVMALLDASGQPRPGWPLSLRGWRCGQDGPPHALPVAADGSIRLVCAEDSPADGPLRHVGLAFDTAGRALPGWPVELPDVGLTTSAAVVGNELRVIASEVQSMEGATTPEQAAAWWLVAVSATGDVRVGRRYEVADAAGSFDVRLATDGIAYRLAFHDTEPIRTEITAFDLDGVRPGWPVTVDGITSQPVVAPDGSLAVVRLTKPGLTSQVLWFPAAGGAPAATSGNLPRDPISDRTGAGGVRVGPIVGADGTAWVVGTVESTKPAISHLVRGSAVVHRYPLDMPLQPQGSCDPQDTGCGVWRALPALGPDGTVFLPESATGGPGLTSSSGGSVVAMAPTGTISRGWPLFLPDTMAGFWSLAARPDGTLVGLEVVPIGAGSQWILVTMGRDGAIHAATPIIQP